MPSLQAPVAASLLCFASCSALRLCLPTLSKLCKPHVKTVVAMGAGASGFWLPWGNGQYPWKYPYLTLTLGKGVTPGDHYVHGCNWLKNKIVHEIEPSVDGRWIESARVTVKFPFNRGPSKCPSDSSTLSPPNPRASSTPTPLRTRHRAKAYPTASSSLVIPITTISITNITTSSQPQSSPHSSRSSSSLSDNSPLGLSHTDLDPGIAPMSSPRTKPTMATITHPKSDHCPILEAGVITPEILQQWCCACQKYLKNCKDYTADDLVSYVANEMCPH
ncbi:hypothetical protein FB451DRAFT_1182680 [Mycena latifolia]|nr:hypothetical protein FB451DRAFT_1182680 [Mycena latifolia]